jgi:OOP family OmpA-OmpF porin
MKPYLFHKRETVLLTLFLCLLIIPSLEAQTKKLKRPRGKVGISSVDNFVQESFDLYDKVYTYDGYAAAGKSLDDEDIDVLEDGIEDVTRLTESTPDILNDLDGAGMIKQGKATLQINRAKKALEYSVTTAKALLLGERASQSEESPDEEGELDKDSEVDTNDAQDESENEQGDISDNMEVYSKFDFVPGDELIFFDDFSQDFIGDFPSKWNTNGSGEVVRLNKVEGNWFEPKPGYDIYYIPDVTNLPEDYTIEFDILSSGLSRDTKSTAMMQIILSDADNFDEGEDSYVYVTIPFGQYSPFDIRTYNYFDNENTIKSRIKADIRNEVKNQPHVAISVTKQRFRLWINQEKFIDIPRFIEKPETLNYIKINVNNLKIGEERIFIKNLKVAKGGVDLRRKLLSEGKISTNGILFDSGSANIQPQSLGIVRQISQVLMQDNSIKLNIIGHTDSDGTDEANLELSKARAAAVKEALVNIFDISPDRLTTDGKGESQPVGDNSTPDGKAQNRRVEFVKL